MELQNREPQESSRNMLYVPGYLYPIIFLLYSWVPCLGFPFYSLYRREEKESLRNPTKRSLYRQLSDSICLLGHLGFIGPFVTCVVDAPSSSWHISWYLVFLHTWDMQELVPQQSDVHSGAERARGALELIGK